MRPIIKTNILQYIGFYKEIVEVKVLFGQRLWGIDSWILMEVLKVGPQYSQSIMVQEGFLGPTNRAIAIRPRGMAQLAGLKPEIVPLHGVVWRAIEHDLPGTQLPYYTRGASYLKRLGGRLS